MIPPPSRAHTTAPLPAGRGAAPKFKNRKTSPDRKSFSCTENTSTVMFSVFATHKVDLKKKIDVGM